MLVHQRVSNESLRIAQKNLLVGKVENLTRATGLVLLNHLSA